jgi:hypothetical protein
VFSDPANPVADFPYQDGKKLLSLGGLYAEVIKTSVGEGKLLVAQDLTENAAKLLLEGEGLSLASLLRALGMDDKKKKDRDSLRKKYYSILESYGKKIYRQGNEFFFNPPRN